MFNKNQEVLICLNKENLKGDLLCIMCGIAYAIDLLVTEKAVSNEEVDAYQMGVFQLGVTGTLNLIMSFLVETPHFPTTATIWASALFLTVFCTGVAFIVQPVAQQYTTASHTGVIFALEPVFAGVVAAVFAHEILSFKSYLGAFLMVASIFIMEIDFSANQIKYINAGHPDVVIELSSGEVENLSSNNMILGILPLADIHCQHIELSSVAKLIAFTDGMYENFHLNLDDALTYLKKDIIRFDQTKQLSDVFKDFPEVIIDDATICMLKFKK